MDRRAPPAVLHYMQDWLPRSEQFVHAIVAGSRHHSVVASRRPLQNRDTFPHRPVHSLGWIPSPRFDSARVPQRLATLAAVVERRLITASLAAMCTAYRVRLVHQHHGYRSGDVAGIVRRLRLPLVVSLYGQDVTTHAQQWPGDMMDALMLAVAVVVPSHYLAERTTSSLGIAAERIRVIPAAGVDVDWFRPTPLPVGPPEALWIGRFVEKKGIDTLLDAWPRVRRRVPNARLRLLGLPGGPLEPRARAAGPGVVVEYTDPRRRAEHVRDAIRASRVVVTPSRTAADDDAESLLLVNLEAQASGRPVVTTRHGGIPEFVDDGRTALVVPEADASSLAEAMIRVLSDESLAGRMAVAGPPWAARFDRAACIAQIDALYDSLLA